jgi:ribonuclease E
MRNANLKIRLTAKYGWVAILIFVINMTLGSAQAAQNVHLAWQASPDTNAVGYIVHYGADSTNYSDQLDVGTNTSGTVTGLPDSGTTYFAVAAYDASGMESPLTVPVSFTGPGPSYAVSVQANPPTSGVVTGAGTFLAGSNVTVTATANIGYTFANWSADGVSLSTSQNYTVALSRNFNLVANFIAIPTNAVPTNSVPTNAVPTNTIPTNTVSTNTVPTNTTPTNAIPTNSVPTNAAPTNTVPTNTVPTNSVPTSAVPTNTIPTNTVSSNTVPTNTTPTNAIPTNSVPTNAAPTNAVPTNTVPTNSVPTNAVPTNTIPTNTVSTNTVPTNTTPTNAIPTNFVPTNAAPTNAVPTNTVPTNSVPTNAVPTNTIPTNTVSTNTVPTNTTPTNAIPTNSVPTNAAPTNAVPTNTVPTNSVPTNAAPTNAAPTNTALQTNTVSVQSGTSFAGAVSGGGAFALGSSVTVAATTNAGFTFTNWTEYGIVQSTSQIYTFTLATNRNLIAHFTTNTGYHIVTVSSGTNGSVTPGAPAAVIQGGHIIFTAAPAGEYLVKQWFVDGKLAQNGGTNFTLTKVMTNHTVGVTFALNPLSKLTVIVHGNGTVTPNLNSQMLSVGGSYSLTATAGAGMIFSGWTSNGMAMAGAPAHTIAHTFVMQRGLVLQANFVPNPFVAVAATYQGLFFDTNGLGNQSSGSCNATVTSNGTYTARLQLGLLTYAIAGQFNLNGQAYASIPRAGTMPLAVQLQLDLTNGVLTGQISDGQWSAELAADPVVTYTARNPAPQAGGYTLVIPGVTNSATQPAGNGFGTATVTALGAISFSGTLADGTVFTAAANVTRQGQTPLYAPLYAGKGTLLGWLTLTNNDLDGGVCWLKLAQPTTKYYPAGFTNNVAAIGSVYHTTAALNFTLGQISLTEGNLSQNIAHQVQLGAAEKVTDLNATKTALVLTAKTGMLTGSVVDPTTGETAVIKAIVLQNQNLVAGYFLGTNQSGSVLLAPTP